MSYLFIIILYLLMLLAVGAWLSKRIVSAESFIVAGRSLPWYVNTGTIVATFVGSGSLIGGAALAYQIGMPAVWFDIGGILAFAALAIMAKKIRKFEGMTTPEILGVRYNRWSQYVGAIIILLAETAIVGYQIRAGAYVLNIISGLNADVGMIITAAFIISYTMFAGLISVAYTDYIQGITIVLALIIGLPFLINNAGGISTIVENIQPERVNFLSMGLYDILSVGLPTFALCFVMQPIWQRIFASKNDIEARKAVFVSVPLLTIIIFILVIFSTVGSYLYQDINPDTVILHIGLVGLPKVLTYLVICAGVAIIVSTGDSMLLSGASNVVNDFYLQFINPGAEDKKTIRVTRWVILLLGIIAYLQVKFFPSVLAMVFYAYTMEGGLAPALFAAFYWKRATPQGGLASVITAGATTVIWELLGKPFGIDTVFPTLIFSTLILIVVSLMTPATDQDVLNKFYSTKA